MNLLFLKPKDQKKRKPEAVKIYADGREVCNLLTKEGYAIYKGRIRTMWERQGRRCCLEGVVGSCPGYLSISEATFEHGEGRGMGGSRRDDRIEVPDKDGKLVPINGAAHPVCNVEKGSVRKSKLLLDLYDVP